MFKLANLDPVYCLSALVQFSAQQIGIRARRFVQICASMASRKSGRSGGDYAITHLDGKMIFCAIWNGGDYVEREECSSLGNSMIRSLLC